LIKNVLNVESDSQGGKHMVLESSKTNRSEEQSNEEIESSIQKMQRYEETLQNIMLQKQQLILTKSEIEEAKKEVAKLGDEEKAYKLVGEVLIEKDKDNLINELDEELKELDIKIKAYEKQEERIREHMKELQKRVVEGLKNK